MFYRSKALIVIIEFVNNLIEIIANYNEEYKYIKLFMNKIFFSVFKIVDKVNIYFLLYIIYFLI